MNLGVTLLGVLYVGGLGSFGTLALGAARPFETPKLDNAGIGVVVAAVLVAVSYDVGAYFIGRALGHTPLNAASPNKTQEGLFGGVFVGIAVPFLILFLSGWDPVGASASKAFAFCLICVEVGCPAIHVTRRDKVIKPSGKEVELAFVEIDSQACTGCGLCVQPCAPDAIQHVSRRDIPIHIVKTTSAS